MKAAGVYYYLSDNSFRAMGSTSLELIVPMLTVKGSLTELNRVTALDYDQIIGYDVAYNGNYLGLKKLVDSVAYVNVMRINAGAVVANIYDEDSGLTTYDKLEVGQSLEETAKTFWFNLKFAGHDTDHYVSCVMREQEQVCAIPVKDPADNNKWKVTFGTPIKLTPQVVDLGTAKVSALVCTGVDKTPIFCVVGSEIKTVDSDPTTGYSVGGDVVGTATETGLEFDDASNSIAKFTGTDFTLKYLASDTEFTIKHSTSADGVMFSLVGEYPVSLDPDSPVYFSKVDMGELEFGVVEGQTPNFALIEEYTLLQSGSNGHAPTAGEIDFTAFDKSLANVCVMNGINDLAVINAFALHAEQKLKYLFAGAPPLPTYDAVADWAKNLYATEYMSLHWVSSIEDTPAGPVYVCPSVNCGIIMANMISSFGTLNYPPAGYTYGNIVVSRLMETNAELFADQLKENKINWQRNGPKGPVMWEQRTRYARESALSSINAIFVLREMRERLIEFASGFNFRILAASDLLVFDKGLRAILDSIRAEGFITEYDLYVPTFLEQQASADPTTLVVRIQVAVTAVTEVIEFQVSLQNTGTVGA